MPPNAYGPQMYNQWRSWTRLNYSQPIPDYELVQNYTTDLNNLRHDSGDLRPMPFINAALEQFRLGARAARDGGNTMNNLAFARGDPAPADVALAAVAPAAAILDIVIPPPDEIVLKFKKQGLDAPAHLNDPVTYDIMDEPVILIGSGNTYNYSTILNLVDNRDPQTNADMRSMAVAPNLLIHRMTIEYCTIEMNKFYAAVKIQAVIRGKLWVYCMLWVLADDPAAVLADADAPAPVLADAEDPVPDEADDPQHQEHCSNCNAMLDINTSIFCVMQISTGEETTVCGDCWDDDLEDDEDYVDTNASSESDEDSDAEVPAAVLADAEDPAAVLADADDPAQVPAEVPAAASHIMHDEALDIWVQTTFGEDYDWGFIFMLSPANLQSAHALLPAFHVLDDNGDTQVGIAIIGREFSSESEIESESEEEEIEDEKARIKAAEGLDDFAEVLNGDGTAIEIDGQRGTYYMTNENQYWGTEGGYFTCIGRFLMLPVTMWYKVYRHDGFAFALNNRVGRVELVDDPDMPAGHGAKAIKVWPAA